MNSLDRQYVSKRELENDLLWQQTERRLYYSYKNSYYIIPTFLLCIVSFLLTNSLFYNIIIVVVVICLCQFNNIKLDYDEYIIKQREIIKKGREVIQ